MSQQENVNLYDLLNLSIRSPQKSEVNFSKLHALLKGVLKQLEVLEKKTRCPDAREAISDVDQEQRTEEEHRIQGNISSSSGTPADGQGRLPSGIQTCEDGESEEQQSDDQLEEMKELCHQQKVVVAQAEMVTVEKYCHRVDALEETLRSLRDTFQSSPDLAKVFKSVTWNIMLSAPLAGREGLQEDLVNSGLEDPSTHEPSHTPSPPRSPSTFGQTLEEETCTLPAAETSQQQSRPDTGRSPAGPPLSPNTTGSDPETAEAMLSLRKLMARFSKLEALVTALSEGKVDKSQLTHLRELIDNKGSVDVSKNLTDQLNQQRALIDGLMSDREKIMELVSSLQEAILLLQAECEKLHETTRCLQVDNKQKQSYIEELSKVTDELGEKKADKLMLESAINTDKSALDSKVSRVQFDSETEQLNALFHELLNKVAGQEQDWHKVIKRLSTEMEFKLNRIEFDPLKTELEDRWNKIHEKLQAQEAPDLDDAAALKKQLVDRFHCLSCDRPVVRNSLAPTLVDVPFLTSPPSHKSIWPFAVKPQEKFRQNNRSKHFSEMKDYGYLAASRSCGGRGTIITRAMMFENLKKMRNARARARQNLSAESEQDVAVRCNSRVYKEGLNEPASRNSEAKRPTSFTKEDKVRCSPYPEHSVSPEMANGSPLLHTHGTKVSRSGHF
ncbi:uncharacterized protein LOC132954370 [Labrus mixtus]|uniref:uncharacterized protein LOC132954370 n=1 Tax=Labrus mixtus TaxID=508554 RepID=UPI0029BFDC9F|nr:uncharacterized protein LOC132954370 [Labrus mixtus]